MTARGIPGVSIFRFLRNTGRILKNPLPFHHENFEKHGDTFQLNIGLGKSVIFSRNAAFAQYVLQKNQKNYIKSEIQTKDLAKYVGHGLLTSNGEDWRKQRRLLQPAFHKKQLKFLLDSMKTAIEVELNKIRPQKNVDVFPIFNDLAFQTVVKSMFSSAVDKKLINRLQYITEQAQQMLVKELRQSYKRWWFYLKGDIKRNLALTQEARQIILELINERRNSSVRFDDLLDMLLDSKYDDGSSMTDDQLIDEILIIFTAGHETTSNALSFTAQLLARDQQIQEKVVTEVTKAKFISEDLFEFIQYCTYTKQVVEEAMRLYPPAYFMDRVNLEKDEFEGMTIPAGSNLLFSFYEIHRSSKYWQEPLIFNPDRFSAEKSGSISGIYFPFGAGPRMCIGNNFAMYEMVLAIADLVGKFKLTASDSLIEILPMITLKPKNALVNFTLR